MFVFVSTSFEGTSLTIVSDLQKAARLGVLPAIYNIGNFYSAGMGGAEKSDARAYQYYFAGAQVFRASENEPSRLTLNLTSFLTSTSTSTLLHCRGEIPRPCSP